MRVPSLTLAVSLFTAIASARFMIYADEWHKTRPTKPEDRAGIDHVILAFAKANSSIASYQPYVPVSTIRQEFPEAKVMVAVGGWNDPGFSDQVVNKDAIKAFARGVGAMIKNLQIDGVDIDWEYPGGNGADYKNITNDKRTGEIPAFPELLAAIRKEIGEEKILSIAVPGKKGDMIAYTADNGPKIWPSVNYINIMAYDLMNRRDTLTNHHTSIAGVREAIQNYINIGAPPEKINLGFAYYAKYFQTDENCTGKELGCKIVLAEDPKTGDDLHTSGAWTFEPNNMNPFDPSKIKDSYDGECGAANMKRCAGGCCSEAGYCGTTAAYCGGGCQHSFGTGCTGPDVHASWQRAAVNGKLDGEAGGKYFYDRQANLFWTWETSEIIDRKFAELVGPYGLGVFAWSLGEDSNDWSHIKKMGEMMKYEGCDE
ncbi:putative glycosyl hydrolase, family 18 [Lojkania enalia]|uniref:chitinase n=1 Tax=Lojkania enalia TaxID=147567 RepID=A0A9P4N642_9PLEO|nr:putative glycosyl hydrolase, family 18 [Didymosphaeria enalia]